MKIEDLKVGDELVCVDREGFDASAGRSEHVTSFIISCIGDGELIINDGATFMNTSAPRSWHNFLIGIADSSAEAISTCRKFMSRKFNNVLQVYEAKSGIEVKFKRFNREYTAFFKVEDFNLNEWKD